MNYTLITNPNDILRTECVEVVKVDSSIRRQIKIMIKAMNDLDGIGLASCQIGYNNRVIVVKDLDTGVDFAMVNPVLLNKSESTTTMSEGCLSNPGKSVVVPRHDEITVEYTTRRGVKVRKRFNGMTARIIQHEIDHISGIMIIDY